jgi:hypothetical protein
LRAPYVPTGRAATNTSVPVLDGNCLEDGVHITSIASSNVGLVKGGFISKKRRELRMRPYCGQN